MTTPRMCVCGHQQSQHKGWEKLGACRAVRIDGNDGHCAEFRLRKLVAGDDR